MSLFWLFAIKGLPASLDNLPCPASIPTTPGVLNNEWANSTFPSNCLSIKSVPIDASGSISL